MSYIIVRTYVCTKLSYCTRRLVLCPDICTYVCKSILSSTEMVKWTRSDFEIEILALSRVFKEKYYAEDGDAQSHVDKSTSHESKHYRLDSWQIENNATGANVRQLFLCHPPVIRQYTKQCARQNDTIDGNDMEDLVGPEFSDVVLDADAVPCQPCQQNI